MPNCSINGCKTSSSNAKERQLKLFSFPKSLETRLKWISACKKPYKFNENNGKFLTMVKFINFDNQTLTIGVWKLVIIRLCSFIARICSKHFPEDAFEKPLIQRMLNYSPTNSRKLKLDAVPTKYLPPFAETEVKFVSLFPFFFSSYSNIKKCCFLNRIDILCNEIENIPMDEIEMIEELDPLDPVSSSTTATDETNDQSSSESAIKVKPEAQASSDEDKKMSRDVRIAYETLLSTYQKFFSENEELKLKNKVLKSDCEKHKKLYEKRLQENIKLRQRNRALFNETVKLRNRLKKYEQTSKCEFILPCNDEIDQEEEPKSIKPEKKTAAKK